MADIQEDIINATETEIEIYAKIGDPQGLFKAQDVEQQVQVSAKLGLEDNYCRVRKSTKNGKDEYTYTFKVKNRSQSDSVMSLIEYTVAINEEFFNDFQLVADNLQNKTRYIFDHDKIQLKYHLNEADKIIEVPDIKYEVDVYTKSDGTLSEWCKIDIEIDKIMQFIDHNYPDLKDIKLNVKISHLPFNPYDSFIKDAEDKDIMKRINDLFDTEFTINLVDLRKSR